MCSKFHDKLDRRSPQKYFHAARSRFVGFELLCLPGMARLCVILALAFAGVLPAAPDPFSHGENFPRRPVACFASLGVAAGCANVHLRRLTRTCGRGGGAGVGVIRSRKNALGLGMSFGDVDEGMSDEMILQRVRFGRGNCGLGWGIGAGDWGRHPQGGVVRWWRSGLGVCGSGVWSLVLRLGGFGDWAVWFGDSNSWSSFRKQVCNDIRSQAVRLETRSCGLQADFAEKLRQPPDSSY